jgi:hypothetical protein
MSRIKTSYEVDFDGSSFSFTITYSNTFDPVIFTAYSFILSTFTGHDHYFIFGETKKSTTLLN